MPNTKSDLRVNEVNISFHRRTKPNFNKVVYYLFIYFIESLLSHKINNHISYVTTLKEGIYINYRENQDKNYKTRLCLKIKRLTNVFLNLSVFILGW